VIDRVEQAYRRGEVPLAAAEGYIRQILGWREYVRGVYWSQMPGYTDSNALHQRHTLPHYFWDADTRMNCMAHALGQSLETAYAHHIQRLMVIGNFALLAGIKASEVHQWYLGVYIDAFEWVEAPNTLGMSQFADGGLLASKPYVSSAAYIDRMSDYCKSCHYQRKKRHGEHACPFNAWYWDFFVRHRQRFAGNHRLGMVYRQLDKMSDNEREAIADYADTLRNSLEKL
jgi:deoxyribodipyrimidine photolyase-related protein